jgi:3-deoxy-D-manno-octulosonate 8-phosphate phosphatase (KDO 8-P phosphatase)
MVTHPPLPHLTPTQLRQRARKLKLILTDNDGVLTDTGVYYAESGEAMKRFSIRDGMGVELLRNDGVETAIITSETSPSVKSRAVKLQMPRVYLGVKDKRAHLDVVLRDHGLTADQIGYIGDDVNDLAIIEEIRKAGLTAAPADAMPVVASAVHYRCQKNGGHGAFRDFAEWILHLRK